MLDIVILAALLQQPAGHHTVVTGDTLSAIAAASGMSLAALEAMNPQVADPDVIHSGQVITTSGGSPAASIAPARVAAAGGGSPGDLVSVPGVPRSFAACVAHAESGNGANQAANGGIYGIIDASGVHGIGPGTPVAAQKAAFSQLYAQYGTAPWSRYDGCR